MLDNNLRPTGCPVLYVFHCMLKSNINTNTVKVKNDWVSLFAPFPGDVVVLEESEDSVVEEESPLSVVLVDSASDAVVDDVVGAVVTGPMEIMSAATFACLCGKPYLVQ